MPKDIENIKKNHKTKYMFILNLIIAVTIVFTIFVNINLTDFINVYSQETRTKSNTNKSNFDRIDR